ncbi:MAG: hypothetical protein HOE90_09480 [Bacteriovoracaceae bacterium]|jgi:hypothetical protein|nr:hypothetical protein [Bacteriovoracaceae bacterium]
MRVQNPSEEAKKYWGKLMLRAKTINPSVEEARVLEIFMSGFTNDTFCSRSSLYGRRAMREYVLGVVEEEFDSSKAPRDIAGKVEDQGPEQDPDPSATLD